MKEQSSIQVLILGIGNLLMSDEGLGVHIVQLLQDRYEFPPNVTVYDGGTGGLSLMAQIDGRDHLLIIDAVLMGEDPGTIAEFTYDSMPEGYIRKDTAHGIDILDVLAAVEIKGKLPETTIMGIQPADIFTPGLELTPEVQASVESLVHAVMDHMARIGIKVRKKS